MLGLLLSTGAGAFVWPSESVRAERALASGDVVERRNAAGALGAMPEPVAAPLLKIALADRDTEVRLRAARSAARLGSTSAADAVVEWLVEPDVRVRLGACDLIRQVPTPRAVAALGRVLGDPDAAVRLAAVAAMGASGSAQATGPLLGHVDDASAEVRVEVIQALTRLGNRAAALPLQGKMGDSAPEVRRAAARALGELGEPRTESALVLALRDAVPAVRAEAVTSLGKLHAADAVPAMAPLLEERAAPEVRVAAVNALGRIGSLTAVRVLIPALAGDDPSAEASPVRDALIACGTAAVPSLAAALRSDVNNVAAGAALALGSIRSPAAADLITQAMHRSSVAPLAGLRALAKLRDPAALAAVLEMIGDPQPFVRKQAIETLNTLLEPARHDGRAIEPIVAALRDAKITPEDREQLVRALGRTGAPRALGFLVPLAAAPVNGLRGAALAALGELGPLGQDATLLAGLSDDLPAVRMGAALSLAVAGGEASVGELLARMRELPAYDRTAWGIALSGTMSRAGARVLPAIDSAYDDAGALERDALIEGLGRLRDAAAGVLLSRWSSHAEDPADRRKIAEALAGHVNQLVAVTRLLRDPDPTVRAAAVWSAGAGQERSAVDALLARAIELSADAELDVAANAVATVARLGRRGDAPTSARAQGALCSALGDPRAYVRANALAGLSVLAVRCERGDRERDLLLRDRSEAVRSAAARLLARRSSTPAVVDEDTRALRKCAGDEPSGAVAAACQLAPAPAAEVAEASLVFVVPDGRTLPAAEARYSLQRADGLIRSGVADRRGALFESQPPTGALQLMAPAALAN